jgi:hypothetical protein
LPTCTATAGAAENRRPDQTKTLSGVGGPTQQFFNLALEAELIAFAKYAPVRLEARWQSL